MNSFSFLDKAARHNPAQRAIVHAGEVVTYGEFRARALAIGGNLRASGCRPGDRIAFCLPNSPRILELIFGCFSAGLVVVPINARLHVREIAYICANSGARLLVHDPDRQAALVADANSFPGLTARICTEPADGALDYATLLRPANSLAGAEEVRPEAACWLFYTSGTTGRPKGAIWTHRMVRVLVMNYLADVHNIQPGEIVLHAAPLSHGSGIVALPAIARGATNVIFDRPSFEPKAVFATIEAFKVAHIAFLAPTQIVRMLQDFIAGEYELSSLRAICYGGAPIYVEHLRNAIAAFGPIFVQIYGQGEAPITISALTAAQHARFLATNDPRIGSAGQVRTDVEARCVDESGSPLAPGEVGEVVARGDIVMPGYWDNFEATAEALRGGWLHTGDIGYFDEEGYLFLLDRSKDMIISGGNNIYPREVEEVIVRHPGVASAVVVGIPHEYWGEAVHAVVVPQPGVSLTAQEIILYCGQYVAGYKKPKSVEFAESLPISGYGKVLRREVRERYWQGNDRRVGGGHAAPKGGAK
jgi:long-chain acyl-CoA synthetase